MNQEKALQRITELLPIFVTQFLESHFASDANAGEAFELGFGERLRSCWKVTLSSIKETLTGRLMIRGKAFQEGFRAFPQLGVRYGLVMIGSSAARKSAARKSATWKSRTLATEADEAVEGLTRAH